MVEIQAPMKAHPEKGGDAGSEKKFFDTDTDTTAVKRLPEVQLSSCPYVGTVDE